MARESVWMWGFVWFHALCAASVSLATESVRTEVWEVRVCLSVCLPLPAVCVRARVCICFGVCVDFVCVFESSSSPGRLRDILCGAVLTRRTKWMIHLALT